MNLVALVLQQLVIEAPLQQWGLDFIKKFKKSSRKGYKWILTTTQYFTRWVETILMKKDTTKVVFEFLEEQLITRFGIPSILVFYNALDCYSLKLFEFALEKCIILQYYVNYYP